jgi:ribosome maturation factor RimP
MSAPASSLHRLDRDAILRIVDPILYVHGAELVDVEFKTERQGWVLRILVEKAGANVQRLSTKDAAVDLELCARIARDLSPALDVEDLIPHAYHLEVGSPGIERALHGERDYVRFVGQKAKLRLTEPLLGQRVIVGVLSGVDQGRVRVLVSEHAVEIPLSIIERARLVFDFGSAGKEPHSQKRKH